MPISRIPLREREQSRDAILVLCGLFETYLAALDPRIFDTITAGDISNRFIVALATVSAAGIPFFFGLGALKEGISPRTHTIFFYEKALKGNAFWLASCVMVFFLALLAYLDGTAVRIEEQIFVGVSLFVGLYMLLTAKRRLGSAIKER